MRGDEEISNGKTRRDTFAVIESCPTDYMAKILTDSHKHLTERVGHFLGYQVNHNCSHYAALSSFLGFHINNVSDPFKESNFGTHSRKFELGVLDWFARLWEVDENDYWGYVTNGGTEGNFHGLLLGRELLPDGILYASRESHYSIFKASRMYKMKCEIIATFPSGEIDCADLKVKLLHNKDKPAIILANIGSSFKGAVDDLDIVIQTLEECGFTEDRYYIHCDAAFLGLILPFLPQGSSKLTFKKPIGSISTSGHKFLASPMPCGVQMARKRHIHVLSKAVEYIASVDTTISGSRNGHASIFMWYGLNTTGHSGFQRDIEKCLENARYFKDRLKKSGISVMLSEMSFTLVFERPLDDDFIRHWQLACFGNMAHVVVMPHVTIQMLDDFVNEFVEKRKIWYQFGTLRQPPCLAEDIGACNCSCLVHGNGTSIEILQATSLLI